ncbi:MAG: hypothetical protein HY277_07305, partial [Ignavibacteriales bacterium]|nr:hypothetical protein [Ignavibacteriales bacterium]
MAICVRVFVFFILPSCAAIAQDSVSISDFRYPETQAIDWKGNATGYFNSGSREGNSFRSSIYPNMSSSNSTHGNFNLYSNFLFFHTKDDRDDNIELSTSGSYSGDRRDQTENDTGVVRRDESNDRSWSGALGASWSVLHYLSDDGFHLMTRLSSGVSGSYSKLNLVTNRSQAQTSEEEIRKSYSLHFQGSLAIGYGRIRDGSFIYRALRVVERLREDGVVNRQLSRSEMLDLADRLARRRDYTTNFERYEKYFVQDIIAELAERGALGSQQLTGLSTLKIVEALRQDIQSRLFGWRVYYAFNDTHDQSRSDGQTIVAGSSAVGYDQFNNDWIYVHEVGAEFGYPFSLFTHLYSKFKVELPNHHYDTRFFMRLTTTLTHEIGERVELGGSVDFTNGSGSVYSYDVDQYTRATSYTISGNFVYF